MRRAISGALLLATLGFFSLTAGDSAPAGDALAESISVSYVLVPFVPLDANGRPLDDLEARDVKVLVDGQEVRTDLFERAADLPVSFTILLDGSGSMGLAGKLEGARAALQTLFLNHRPGDEYALYLCANGKVSELVPFTASGTEILRAFDRVEPYGRTTLFDAVVRMPDKTILGRNGSRAIILLTDGLDNASETDRETLLTMLQGVEVPVYPLGLVKRRSLLPPLEGTLESRLDMGVLGDLARMSGGRLAIAAEPEELQKAIQTLVGELRSQYLVGFAPSGEGSVRYRKIALDIEGPVETIRVRSGYRGTDPPLVAGKANIKAK